MIAFVCHTSALQFCRRHHALLPSAPYLPFAECDCAYSAQKLDLHILSEYGFATPLHVAVGRKEVRRESSAVKTHRSPSLPLNAFKVISSSFAIATPELIFLQMAEKCSLPHLAMIGYELCGCYSLDGTQEKGFSEHKPLTSTERISAFLDELERIGSTRKIKYARRALKHIANDSGSPKETELALLLCLPHNLGGFALPLPEMNSVIELCDESRKLYDARFCKADLLWPKARICVEYDSDAHHGNALALNKDAARRNALERQGYHVITVTRSQLSNDRVFTELAQIIAKAIGKRIQIRCSDFDEKRTRLRHEVLGAGTWIQHGRLR